LTQNEKKILFFLSKKLGEKSDCLGPLKLTQPSGNRATASSSIYLFADCDCSCSISFAKRLLIVYANLTQQH